MASLVYDILTDPAPLHVSEPGEESRGAVCVVVSNPTNDEAIWYSMEVRVPFGGKGGDLTPRPEAITARVGQNHATEQGKEPMESWDTENGVFTVSPQPGTLFKEAGSLVLVLDGFPVSSEPGLVLPQVTERAANGARVRKNPVPLSLLKQVPRVPRDFRPKESLVAGKDVVLQWDGPDTLVYTIQGPDGPPGANAANTKWVGTTTPARDGSNSRNPE